VIKIKTERFYLSDFEFVEDVLKHLIILNHFIFILSIKIHLMHRNNSRMSGIKKLTMNRTGTSLTKIEQFKNQIGKTINN
jgi:hypothetical protein